MVAILSSETWVNAKPLPELTLTMPKNKLEWSLHQEKTLFIQGKPLRNVISKVATISLRIPHDNDVDRRNQILKRLKTILSPQVHFFNISRSRQNGHHFTNSILNAFPSMKISEFPMTFHWNLFLQVQLRISHHRYRLWLDAKQTVISTNDGLVCYCICVSLNLNELIRKKQQWGLITKHR